MAQHGPHTMLKAVTDHDPQDASAYYSPRTLPRTARHAETVTAYRRSPRLRMNHPATYVSLACAFKDSGRILRASIAAITESSIFLAKMAHQGCMRIELGFWRARPHSGAGEHLVGWVQRTVNAARLVGCTHPTMKPSWKWIVSNAARVRAFGEDRTLGSTACISQRHTQLSWS
jgi:hypothetical protein